MFYWPDGLTPETYTGYRPRYDDEVGLNIDEVSHVELSNVMVAALNSNATMDKEALIRGTMEVFGWVRMGAKIKERMDAVLDWLVSLGRITVADDGTVALAAG